MPHSCAFGCKETNVIVHCFPNPEKFPERFKLWVSLLGGKLETASDYEYFKKKRICDIHFVEAHRNRYKRLNALAVPTLHLPALPRSQQPLDNQFNAAAEVATANAEAPATQLSNVPSENLQTDTVSGRPNTLIEAPANQLSNVTSENLQTDTVSGRPNSLIGEKKAAAAIVNEHNYSVISRRKHNTSNDAPRKTDPAGTLLTKPLHMQVRYLRTEICRLRNKAKSFKRRLHNAEKLNSNVAFQRLVKSMTKPAQLFMNMQQQASKKPKGRRFSIEEKILSLSLFKRSPKSYRLMAKYFALPSSKSMKRLLSQIKLKPGINPIIFEKINKSMEEKDVSEMYDVNEICIDLQYDSDSGQRNYVCGWIVWKCLINVVKNCQHCRDLLLESNINKNNAYIKAKEYNGNKKWLCYPSQKMEKYFQDIQNITTCILQKDVPKKGLKSRILLYIDLFIDDPFNCIKHKDDLKKHFMDCSLNVIIYSWCRAINRILAGKITYEGIDQIKLDAQKYYNKHRNYKNRK